MNQLLIMACQMFLVPATILFAALGVAPTESLKTLISAMGIATSGVWYYRIMVWTGLEPADNTTARLLAGLFLLAWTLSFLVHLYRWLTGKEPAKAQPPSL
jgi:hypothetical protein